MNRLAAAILAYAANDLLSGRDTVEILAWIDGAPALLPFAVCCHLASVEADRTRLAAVSRWSRTRKVLAPVYRRGGLAHVAN